MRKIRICPDFTQDDSFLIEIRHNPILDLTGAVFDFIMKEKETSSTNVLTISHTVGDYADDDPTNGVVYIPVTREDTSAVNPGYYLGGIKRTIGINTLTLIKSGKDNVEPIRVYKTFIEKVV